MPLRLPHVLLLSVASLSLVVGGCQRQGADLKGEVDRLTVELEGTKQKLAAAERSLMSQKDTQELSLNINEKSKTLLMEKDQLINQKDAEIKGLQAAVAEAKGRESNVYAEISAVQQKGLTSIAVQRYEQFIRDYPNSPLVADAKRSVAELSVIAQKEEAWKTNLIDPKKPERIALQHFNDGIATMEELAPILKRKTQAEVVKLLGPPNKTYRNGTELGYEDKVIDSSTGGKGTLVIMFEGERVSSLRVGYGGRQIKP